MDLIRCPWAHDVSVREMTYHDTEWGVPRREALQLFEMLILEGAQAGLSWRTILDKREAYRRVFAGFDPEYMARINQEQRALLLEDRGIVRNRKKMDAAVHNARAFLDLREKGVDFADYLWGFVEGEPRCNHWEQSAQVPVSTPESDAMSRGLKQLGFSFVGPTICYALMQAVGMVNDHLTSCFRHSEILRDVAQVQGLASD